MKLHPEGREYARWTIADAPAEAAVEVSFDGGTTWTTTLRTGDELRVLVAGPDATNNPAEAVLLPFGTSLALLRLADVPELILRSAGFITVTTEL